MKNVYNFRFKSKKNAVITSIYMYKYIDEATIYNYLGKDNPELIRELLGLVLSINLVELEELPEFYKKEDFATVKKRVHKAKPSLSYIGAEKTLELIHKIEENLQASAPTNELLQEHVQTIRQELNTFIESL